MRVSKYFVTVIIIVTLSITGLFAGEKSEAYWNKFSKNLVHALKSENTGVKQSAMQMVIRFKDHVDVDEARFAVMDVFKKSNNRQERQLALMTLYAIGHTLDMGYLERYVSFEEDAVVKRQIAAILVTKGRLPQSYLTADNQVAGL